MRRMSALFPGMALGLMMGMAAQGAGPVFKLYDPGTEDIVDYSKYGELKNVGTRQFQYVMSDPAGLARASGEGVDPSTAVTNNPEFQKAKASGVLKTDWWKHVNSGNPQMDYFVWSVASEDPGVRLLHVGKAFEKGGHLMQALKAYRSAMILYPDASCWSSGSEFQWDVATAAWNCIMNLLRMHPELNLKLTGADVITRTEPAGLAISVNPGVLERIDPAAAPATGDVHAVVMQRGTGTVQLVQYAGGDWQMLVEGKPYFIQGLCYAPTRIGVVPWEWNWLWSDENTNGVLDSFEVWMDANQNNRRDADEPITSDYQLLKNIGCNTIKFYLTDPELAVVNVLAMRKMHAETGLRAIVGNFLGAYCNGSGADWEAGTDYKDPKQRANMRASVSNMVMKLRHEPWVLAWVLGNENNMEMSGDVNATRTNGSKEPEAFAGFLNEVAAMIHEMDPDHPVGVGNLLTGLVEYYGKHAPELDFIGINSYLGEDGFGATWQKVKQAANRPVCIMEWGCDSYYTDRGPDEDMQVRYLQRNLADIQHNSAGHPGAGNAIGGFVFEWLDEWWKDTLNYFEDKIDHQTTRAVFPMPFPDGQAQEEWFGIMGQGAGNASPFQRVPKKAYYALKDIWVGVPEGGKEGQQGR